MTLIRIKLTKSDTFRGQSEAATKAGKRAVFSSCGRDPDQKRWIQAGFAQTAEELVAKADEIRHRASERQGGA